MRFVLACLRSALFAGLGLPLFAQCTTDWTSGGPQPQLTGHAMCMTQWDPDGAGPAPLQLVVGGINLIGGTQPIDQMVMMWDGSQWQSLGAGPGTDPVGTAQVNALTVWNGLLVAGGNFTGPGMNYIALWSGAAWQPLGAGFPVAVNQLTVWNNQLVAVSQSGGVPVVRTWDGVTWTALPTPPNLMFPNAVIPYQGQLVVAGIENTPTQGVLERWNGTTWLPSIFAQHGINCLGVRASLAVGGSDILYAAGLFTSIGGTPAAHIASTSGGSAFAWSPVANGLPAACTALHVRPVALTGTAIVAVVNSTTTPLLQLSAGQFVAMGNTTARSLAFYSSAYHVTNSVAGDDACQRFTAGQWQPVRGPGLVGEVRALCPAGPDMIVGGAFATVSGATLNHVARWDGTAFTPLGAGMTGTSVDALQPLANGDIVAGGLFLQSGSTALNHIGRWDGSAWSPLGSGMNQQVLALCRLPNGDVIAGGKFTAAGGALCSHIARWDGTTWSPLGTGFNGDVLALTVRSDGTVFAGGSFTNAGAVVCNHVARWNGTTWLAVGAGTNGDVLGLALRPNGDLVAVGAFTSAGGLPASRCALWNGVAWSSMGAVSVDPMPAFAVGVLPNGDVVGGRGFHQPAMVRDQGIARWNGSSWSGFGSGLQEYYSVYSTAVHALAMRADGALVVGGSFSAAGGQGSKSLAVLSSTCAASATPLGTGCSSAAGPIVLTADSLPWIGTTFRTTTTGIAPLTLCLGVIGFAPTAIPLASVLPQGQPGCSLLAAPDLVDVLAPGAGTVSSTLALANDPALIGLPFYAQTIPCEFDLTGNIAAFRASNALAVQIGSW